MLALFLDSGSAPCPAPAFRRNDESITIRTGPFDGKSSSIRKETPCPQSLKNFVGFARHCVLCVIDAARPSQSFIEMAWVSSI